MLYLNLVINTKRPRIILATRIELDKGITNNIISDNNNGVKVKAPIQKTNRFCID